MVSTQNAARAPADPLPAMAGQLIGRDGDIAVARDMLASGETRLLTLTGPGGVGKTALALAVAHELAPDYADGAYFVDLAPLREAALVPAAIGRAVGLRPPGNVGADDALRTYLRDSTALLVLDNFEHLLEATPALGLLLGSCPNIALLLTTRERLRIRWERTLPVEPLPVSSIGAIDADRYGDVPSIALFVRRAQAIDPGFSLDQSNARDVAAICSYVDGLPLAIELAAAQSNILAPGDIFRRLEGHLDQVASGSRDAPVRHETMRAAIAWSYRLLDAHEQAVFRRLAIFAAGWTAEAAEAVTSSKELGLDTLAGLASLTEKSLIRNAKRPDGTRRFAMLETIREFALAELDESGDRAVTAERHRAFYLALAEQADVEGMGPAWYDRLEPEIENYRQILNQASADPEGDLTGLRIATALFFYFWQRGHAADGRRWLSVLLDRTHEAPVELKIRALDALGTLAGWAGDYEAGVNALDEARRFADETNDDAARARLVGRYGWIAWINGHYERIPEYQNHAESMNEELDPWILGHAWLGFGHLLFDGGPPDAAIRAFERSIDLFKICTREKHGIAHALTKLALLRREEPNRERVKQLALEGIDFARTLHDPHVTAFAADDVAQLVDAQAPPPDLARLLAAADGLRTRLAWGRTPNEQAHYMQVYSRLAQQLDKAGLEAIRVEGRALSIDQVLDLAQRLVERATSDSPGGTTSRPAPMAGLSSREREVLRLLADGCSNRDMADSLVLSVRTVEKHVANVYSKIGARGRADAAAFAVRNGLMDTE